MKIDLEKRLHQDNLKAEVYHKFKNRFAHSGYEMICEYKFGKCRFDLLVCDNTGDVCVLIEVRRIGTLNPPQINGKKHFKYSQHGVMLWYISEFGHVEELLDRLEILFKNHQDVLRQAM